MARLVDVRHLVEETGVTANEIRKLIVGGDIEVAGTSSTGSLLVDEEDALEVISDIYDLDSDDEDEDEDDDD